MRHRRRLREIVPFGLGILIALAAVQPTLAVSYFVNRASSSCSDTGPGTSAAPYCTISAAVTKRAAPGVSILVSPAVYREDVRISTNGTSGNPLIIAASSPQVIVEGADDFSSASQWIVYSGNVWRASAVSWNPKQVFVDGSRLTPSSSSPGSLSINAFRWVSGDGLYVNIGGTNPGTRQTLVGRRASGFRLNGVSWVNVDGFTISHTEDTAISVSPMSTNCEISGNAISFANVHGLTVRESSDILIKSNFVSKSNDHGIYLIASTDCVVQENETFENARPETRAANGINLSESSGNVVLRNRAYENQDSGVQLNSSANDNLFLQNQSWDNGDHGYDHLESEGNRHIGDVAYRNYKDGFSIEGDSPNTTLVNCISVDNGLTTGEFNLWIDDSSEAGFISNYNIFWNSVSQAPIKYVDTIYSSVVTYASESGHDGHSFQANPQFVSAAAGNFRLRSSSTAIDCADSSVPGWPATDADGFLRYDVSNVTNTGKGPPVTYADRGAFEFVGTGTSPNRPPNGTIDTPSSDVTVMAGQSVRFTATGQDPDADAQLTFAWSFDGGAANRTVEDPGFVLFAATGRYTVSLTVRDSLGLPDPTPDTVVVTVVANQPPDGTISSPAGDVTIVQGQTVDCRAAASDPDGHTPITYLWTFGGGATNRTIEDPGLVTFSTLGTFTVSFTVTDALGLQDPSPARRVVTVLPPNLPPNGVIQTPVASNSTLTAGQSLSFSATGSDPDGHTPLVYAWNFGGGAPNRTGQDPGSVTFSVAGTYTVTLTVTDARGLADPTPDTRWVFVRPNIAPQGAILSPVESLTIGSGHSVIFSGTGVDSDGHLPLSYLWTFGGGAPDQTSQNPGAVTFNAPGTYTVTLIVRDAMGIADPNPETRVVTVTGGVNLVGNPSFETDSSGWASYGGASLQRIAGGPDGAWSLAARGPLSMSAFGINDAPSWVTSTTAGARYRVTIFVRSAAGGGKARLTVREYLDGVLAGPSATATLTLSPVWQRLSLDYTAHRNGSTLDLHILESPSIEEDVLFVDSVTVQYSPPSIAGSTGGDPRPPRATRRVRPRP